MLLQYYIKRVYGKQRVYLKDIKRQAAIELLTGRKTILSSDVEALKMLGFDFEEVKEEEPEREPYENPPAKFTEFDN